MHRGEYPLAKKGLGLEMMIDAHTAAALTATRAETWRKWARQGRIPVLKIGRRVRFRLADVQEMLKCHDCPSRETREER